MASKKASKKKSKKAAVPSSASFAKDLEKVFLKHGIKTLTISSEASLKCPDGYHPEMVPKQDANGDTVLVRTCVKDD